jgi:hypothetical protein
MREMAVSEEMTSDREKWWKRPCCADPKMKWEKGRKKKIYIHHSRLISEWVAEASQIFLRDAHV